MKTPLILFEKGRYRLASLRAFTITMIGLQSASAQTPVTAVFTHLTNATTSSTYTGTGATGNAASGFTGNTYTYEFGTVVSATNNDQILDSFTALSENFHYQTAAMNVIFRRANNASVTGLRKNLWYESTSATVNAGGTAQLYPDYDDSLERLFAKRLFNVGMDNIFQNATTTNNNNIERLDVIIPNGVTASDNTKAGFVVFDRGNSGSHDPFYIAAITSLDGSGNPSGYDAALSVTGANYGSNVGGNLNYLILRRNPGDPGLLLMDNETTQNRDGVLVRFSDLGVANNTRIYGYSLFATDDVFSPTSDMVNYANATWFPTTTDYGTAGGGLDPLAVTGLWVTSASYVVLAESFGSFAAVLLDGQAQLSWQLGVVASPSTLVVERSGDGVGFTTLMELSPAGPGPQTIVDPQPLSGNNYYRLALVNPDGTVGAYSQVCMIDNTITVMGGPSLTIYPNPVRNGQLEIEAKGLTSGNYVLRLFDLNGVLMLSKECSGPPAMNQTINLPARLAGGIYSVQLTDKNGHMFFIKQILIP